MALIGTLRTKMTKVVVGLVAISMIFFIVGSDLFGNGPRSIFGGDKNEVGKIAGHSIMIDEYQMAIRERENSYILNTGRQPGERESAQLRNEAWELLILRYAITPQFRKVGVKVTTEEQWDMVQGKNMEENIKTSFVDSSGRFDRTRLISWMQSLDRPEMAQDRARWDAFRQSLIPGRERLKYEYLVVKTNYVTEAEAERDYHNQNDVVEAKYVYVPFFAVSDSLVNPSESDIKAYYDKTKEKYHTEASRSLSYVQFPVTPTAEDSASIKQEFEKVVAGFATTPDDSLYAVNNSDGKNPYATYTMANLPSFLADPQSPLKAGTIFDETIEGGFYKIVKLSKISSDTIYNAKASHILIKWDNETVEGKKVAKEKARKILREIRGGADFAAKAREFGTDGTASTGGDLGWFSSGRMVKPFEDAVFRATKKGLLDDVVETQFGYHIIEVTAVKNNTTYSIATIEREIVPSDATHNAAFREADAFAHELKGVDAFKEKAKKENHGVYQANGIGANDRKVNNLTDARRMVAWLFREASVGDISEVFDLENSYIVAVMTEEIEEGVKPLAKVRDEIMPKVKDELKGKIIMNKLAGINGDLQQLADAYSKDASVNTASDIKLNTNSLQGVGFDPIAVGKAFSMENGKRSKPFVGENGVLVVEVQNKTIAPAIGDYAMFKTQLSQNLNSRSLYSVPEAIKKAANIKDMRYRFY